MTKRKPFSILKWLVFPSLTLALAATIAWFNVAAFGWQDGAVYIGVVAVITAFSIAINKYVRLIDDDDDSNDRLAIGAFVFEIVLTLILAINAAYSLSIQREMSIARQAEGRQSQDLETVSKLKDRRAQREAAKMLREQSQGARSSQTIFATNERPLFWIMVVEMLTYIIAAFSLYAFAQLTRRSNRKPATTFPQDDFPDEIDADTRSERNQSRFDWEASHARNIASQGSGEASQDGLKALQEICSAISFHTPGRWFAVDLRPDHVRVRLRTRVDGREMTLKTARLTLEVLRDALTMPRDQFRARVERSLNRAGFQLTED